jgi:hypothetical protein
MCVVCGSGVWVCTSLLFCAAAQCECLCSDARCSVVAMSRRVHPPLEALASFVLP